MGCWELSPCASSSSSCPSPSRSVTAPPVEKTQEPRGVISSQHHRVHVIGHTCPSPLWLCSISHVQFLDQRVGARSPGHSADTTDVHSAARCSQSPPRPGVLPEQPVGGVTSVGDVVEEHLQLLVVVKVRRNDCTNGGRSREPPRRNILQAADCAVSPEFLLFTAPRPLSTYSEP